MRSHTSQEHRAPSHISPETSSATVQGKNSAPRLHIWILGLEILVGPVLGPYLLISIYGGEPRGFLNVSKLAWPGPNKSSPHDGLLTHLQNSFSWLLRSKEQLPLPNQLNSSFRPQLARHLPLIAEPTSAPFLTLTHLLQLIVQTRSGQGQEDLAYGTQEAPVPFEDPGYPKPSMTLLNLCQNAHLCEREGDTHLEAIF